MTVHLSGSVWKWGDVITNEVIEIIGNAITENKEYNRVNHPKELPFYTPGVYAIMSDADTMVYNIGVFLDHYVEDNQASLSEAKDFTSKAPIPEDANILLCGVLKYLEVTFKP